MNCNQGDDQERKDHRVQNVEPQQRVRIYGVTAEQVKAQVRTHHGNGRDNVRSYCGAPVRQLIPGQQIARVTQ